MNNASPILYLGHIQEALERMHRYMPESLEALRSDEKTQDAIMRNFQIIGEAAKRLPDDIKNRCPDIPWQRAVDMRNYIIHDYADIDWDIVWNTLVEDLPALREALKELLRMEGWEE